MNAEELRERVRRHYAAMDKPLLLSDFGVELRSAGLWPIDGEVRPLAEVLAERAPDLVLTSDPDARAYVVVTVRGEEERASRAFEQRRRQRLLKHLPRAVLLSFCVELEPSQHIYLRKEPPHRYSLEPPAGDEYWDVEPDVRTPGLFIDANRELSENDSERLMSNIYRWADRHQVDLDALAAGTVKPKPGLARPVPGRLAANALERLHNAQLPEMASRLVVPMDIALLLSRMP